MRVGIVGASTLLGRELADVIGDTVLATADIVLLDQEDATGQLTAVSDEPKLIQPIEQSSFQGMDLCFFTSATAKYWEMARDAGAGIVDLTRTLQTQAGTALGTPWVDGLGGIDVATTVVLPADIVAVLLALVAARCARVGLKSLSATVLVPASERGQAGLDEMQRQSIALLSFQPLPKEEFDAQVAFNLLPSLGMAAKLTMDSAAERIRSDYAVARAGTLPPLALQMIHAPVFHGYGLSILLGFDKGVVAATVEATLSSGGHVEVVSKASIPPSNLTAAGQAVATAQVTQETASRIWVWMTADNIRLGALHAIACGMEMQRLRPRGKLQ